MNDHALFFGRDDLLATALGRIDRSRLVAIIGSSGSGKSSVVSAGIVSSLARGALRGSERWPVVSIVPGTDPFAALAASVAALPAVPDDAAALLTELTSDVNVLARIGARLVDGDGASSLPSISSRSCSASATATREHGSWGCSSPPPPRPADRSPSWSLCGPTSTDS